MLDFISPPTLKHDSYSSTPRGVETKEFRYEHIRMRSTWLKMVNSGHVIFLSIFVIFFILYSLEFLKYNYNL
jgi:hypothetical protein